MNLEYYTHNIQNGHHKIIKISQKIPYKKEVCINNITDKYNLKFLHTNKKLSRSSMIFKIFGQKFWMIQGVFQLSYATGTWILYLLAKEATGKCRLWAAYKCRKKLRYINYTLYLYENFIIERFSFCTT